MVTAEALRVVLPEPRTREYPQAPTIQTPKEIVLAPGQVVPVHKEEITDYRLVMGAFPDEAPGSPMHIPYPPRVEHAINIYGPDGFHDYKRMKERQKPVIRRVSFGGSEEPAQA